MKGLVKIGVSCCSEGLRKDRKGFVRSEGGDGGSRCWAGLWYWKMSGGKETGRFNGELSNGYRW